MNPDNDTDRETEGHVFSCAPDPIVCVSDLFWDEHWSSEQQLMSRLSKRGRVLYVERPISPFSFFTRSSDASIGRQVRLWLAGGMRSESPTLTILTPPPVLPFRYVRLVNAFNEWILLHSIKRALKRIGATRPVLWVYPPDAGRLIGKVGEVYSMYFCADDWAAWGEWWNRPRDIRAREEELGSKVDLIVGTSTKIVNRWNHCGRKAILVLNGADVDSFKQARDHKLDVPDDLQRIPEPRIGFVGFIDGRLDIKLYEFLASSKPEWSFVLVGPLDEKRLAKSRLRKMPNVHFLGARSRAQLPAYLKGFNVCTIPYICDTLSESIFPLKIFEYLAAGRPVVTTALPELQPFTTLIRIARSAPEFLEALELSLNSPLEQATMTFLDANSWDTKADFLWNKLLSEIEASDRGIRTCDSQ